MVNGCPDETLLSSTGGSQEDAAFDRTVEALQGIVLGTHARTHTALLLHSLTCCMLCSRAEDEFYRLHEEFLAKHCHHFEDCEENKHIYMDVFRSYVRAPPYTPPTRVHPPLLSPTDRHCRAVH